MQVIEIDAIGAQPAQRLFARSLERFRAAIDRALAVHAGHPALARQEDALAKRREHLADELFVAAEAVERRGIEVIDAEVERRLEQRARGLRARRHAVRMAQVHAAEPDREYAAIADMAAGGGGGAHRVTGYAPIAARARAACDSRAGPGARWRSARRLRGSRR